MLRDIPNQVKIKEHVVKIVPTSKYEIYSHCITNEKLNIHREINQINKEKIDLIYEQNYNTKEGKRISNEGDLAYQKALFELYEEIFAELREVAKNLK
jgi:hypothetical protein